MKTIEPLETIDVTLDAPGSKSITQRALVAAALAEGDSVLLNPLVSEDTDYSIAALRKMGVVIECEPEQWRITGRGGRISAACLPRQAAEIFLGNNGTATRFLTSVAALAEGGAIRIDGDQRMRERPIGPLLAALRGWGVAIADDLGNSCPPLTITGQGIDGGATILPEGKSSQYLSSLLLVAPYARRKAAIRVEGEVLSKPYVAMTIAVMAEFGVQSEFNHDFTEFAVEPGHYQGRVYEIEGDASSASYFWAAAAVTAGRVQVANVPAPSLQGDAMLVALLARMGCEVNAAERLPGRQTGGFVLSGSKNLQGIDVDMAAMPDVAPTLAVVAAFAHGDTVIRNIGHLRIKECDRLSAVVTELRKLGVAADEFPDKMVIHGNGGHGLRGARIDTYHDHRMAMSFAVAGLKIPGVEIMDEGCVKKSFPDFWRRWALLAGR
ncbi:MAG: 3-phosphoshikimate 1-carboxyvinyltransferase [Desulfobulbaceae bacterium]|jgi:3-phosphoshikimate 1-carboxyvinyltransferase|nr:3-phosphoshikimate 1-carboxyvinyltransferase [Desulfobulbaceae bacterium]